MGITRRGLLGGAGMLAALTALPGAAFAAERAIAAVAPSATSTKFSKEQFVALQGSVFEVLAHVPQSLTLLSVDDIPAPPAPNLASFAVMPKSLAPDRNVVAFALHFRGGSTRLASGNWLVKNDTLGEFRMFLVPSRDGQLLYTAIFAHL